MLKLTCATIALVALANPALAAGCANPAEAAALKTAVMQQELLTIWGATRKTVLFITHDIDEAVTLATRIGVMHAGPASKLKATIDVNLSPTERDRTNDGYVAVYRQVHALLRDEVAIAMRRAS